MSDAGSEFEISSVSGDPTDIRNITGTVSLPTGAATAANQSTANTTLGSLLTELQQKTEPADTQTIAGTVTANAGTNLNTSALALNATLTDKSQFTKITDGTDTALVTAAGELNVLATAQPGVDIGDVTVNNSLLVTSSGTILAIDSAVTLDMTGYDVGTIAVQINGLTAPDYAVVNFETTADGTNWIALAGQNLTALDGQNLPTAAPNGDGIYTFPASGLKKFRVRTVGLLAGPVSVSINGAPSANMLTGALAYLYVRQPDADTWVVTDAAAEASLGAINAKLVSGTDIGDVTINNASGAAAVNVQDGGNSLTVDGTVAATQSGTWNIGTVTTVTNVVHVDDNSGSITVDNVGTFAVQSTIAAGATNIAKAEDAASADADVGVPAMAIRKATPANTSGTDGDYEMLQMSAGRLWTSSTIDAALPAGSNAIGKLAANTGVTIGAVEIAAAQTLSTVTTVGTVSTITNVVHVDDNSSSLTVDNGGTFAVQATVAAGATNIAKAEDVASADADVGVPAMAIRKATPANTSGTDGDYEMLQMSGGRLWVDPSGVTLTVGSHAVTIASGGVASGAIASGAVASGAVASGAVASGAFASGSIAAGAVAAGAASFVKLEDVPFADADAGVPAMAVRKATPANTSGTDGDYEMLQMSAGRLWTSANIENATLAVTQSGVWTLAYVVATGTYDYDAASATAAQASTNHDYTAPGAIALRRVVASASGRIKITVQVETGSGTGVFNTKFIQFNSPGNLTVDFDINPSISVASGAKVRVIKYNQDTQPQDIYSSIGTTT